MKAQIVQSLDPVTLVGGGDASPADLDYALAQAPVLVAADGGAGLALRCGRMPDAVIGDLDSLRAQDRARIPVTHLHQITEQDSTDFDKALRSIAAPVVVGVGFLGGRLDHQLAVLNALVRYPDRACVLVGQGEVVFHVPDQIALDLEAGDLVSLFPMAPVQGRSTGLVWPIDGLALSPDGRVGTSNRAQGPVQLHMEGSGLLAMVPRARLSVIMQAIAPNRTALPVPATGP